MIVAESQGHVVLRRSTEYGENCGSEVSVTTERYSWYKKYSS